MGWKQEKKTWHLASRRCNLMFRPHESVGLALGSKPVYGAPSPFKEDIQAIKKKKKKSDHLD